MIKRNKITLFLFFILSLNSITAHADIAWSAPVTLSTSGVNASDPQIVVDSSGNATAAWVENNQIKVSTHPVNGSWGAATTLSNILNTALNPKLGVDSSGNLTAVWLENGAISGIVNSATTTAGVWGVGTSISNALGGASAPALSVDASGNAVAVWVRGGVIESNTRSSGVWGVSATTLSGSSADSPQVAISANGTVIAIWHIVVSSADVIQSATKTLGGSWASAKSLFAGTAALKHNYPKVAIDSNGNAIAVWFRYNFLSNAYQNVSVLASSLTFNASSWTIPTIISSPGIRNPADLSLRIAFDSNGNVIVFWTNSYDGEIFWCEVSPMSVAGPWNPLTHPYLPSIYTFGGDISVNSIGDVLTTYMYWDGTNVKIQTQESDISTPVSFSCWTNPQIVSSTNDNGYPRCAQTLNGTTSNAAVVWITYDGANTLIQAATGSKSELSPPTNLTIVQNTKNLGFLQDFYNTLSWQASPSANIIQYNIYRNGVFFTATDANTFQIIDHNAPQSGSVTYGVAAMDSLYSQSSTATISFP